MGKEGEGTIAGGGRAIQPEGVTIRRVGAASASEGRRSRGSGDARGTERSEHERGNETGPQSERERHRSTSFTSM